MGVSEYLRVHMKLGWIPFTGRHRLGHPKVDTTAVNVQAVKVYLASFSTPNVMLMRC